MQTTTNMTNMQRVLLHLAFQPIQDCNANDMFAWFVAQWCVMRRNGATVTDFWANLSRYEKETEKGISGTPLFIAPEVISASGHTAETLRVAEALC